MTIAAVGNRQELQQRIDELEDEISRMRNTIEEAAQRELGVTEQIKALRSRLAIGDMKANKKADELEAEYRSLIRQNHALCEMILDVECELTPLRDVLRDFRRRIVKARPSARRDRKNQAGASPRAF